MKIGDLAKKTGLTERMLRHYEQLGIITPDRTEGGTRSYTDRDVEVASLIRCLRELEIPLDTVAAIAKERRVHVTGDRAGRAIGDMLRDLAADLIQKAEHALALHKVVAEAAKTVRSCDGCKNKPGPNTCPECPMNAAADSNSVAAMIWRRD